MSLILQGGRGGPLVGERASACVPDTPLWSRVPSRDEFGRPFSDFRMLFPGLRQRSVGEQRAILQRVAEVLLRYGQWVVFADLNMRTNLLWVSIRPRPGLTVEIPAAILDVVPEARLLAAYWRRR